MGPRGVFLARELVFGEPPTLTIAAENTYPAGAVAGVPRSDPREFPPSFPAHAVWISQRPHQESFQ